MPTDPKYLRINDAEDPDRADKFARSLKLMGGNGNSVLRELIDALNRYVDEHGRGPAFPVDLVPAKPARKPRR